MSDVVNTVLSFRNEHAEAWNNYITFAQALTLLTAPGPVKLVAIAGESIKCHPTDKPLDTASEPGKADSSSVEDSGHTGDTSTPVPADPLLHYLDLTNPIASGYVADGGAVVDSCGGYYDSTCVDYFVYATNGSRTVNAMTTAVGGEELPNPAFATNSSSLLCFESMTSPCGGADTIVIPYYSTARDALEDFAGVGGFDLQGALDAGVDPNAIAGMLTYIGYALSGVDAGRMLMGGSDCIGEETPVCE